jgi:Helix-turn-helix domain
MASADLLLHPLRLRIVQAFLGDRQLTTGQLLAELTDIPPATLYRQVATLTRAGLLLVVDERQVRGTVERTYALSLQDAQLDSDDLRAMTPDDHRRAFMGFVASLLADFDGYLASGEINFERDGAGYRSVALWLTDDELTGLFTEIGAAVQARSTNTPVGGRRRRMLSTVLLPQSPPATPVADDDAEDSGADGESGQELSGGLVSGPS